MVQFTKKELYGGALTTKLPKGLLDASEFRQVPDTQEVFVTDSENTTNYDDMVKTDSIIIDLMEALETTNVDEALKEHFAEISTLNDNESNWKLLNSNKVENSLESDAVVGVGLEPALKWGRKEQVTGKSSEFKPTLVVVLGLIRLKKVETDILLTYNVLFNDGDELQQLHELDQSGFVESENKAYKRIKFAIDTTTQAINEFKVEQWDLFG